LRVWFSSPLLARLCEKAFRQCRAGDPSATFAEIYVVDASAPDWEPPAEWDGAAGFSSRELDNILGTENLRGFYHHEIPSWQFYDRANFFGVMTLTRPLAIPPWESGSPLRLFLHWAYAAAGMRLTHAATLGVNGRGALIVGPSGSGKSGTALAGLLNGLDSAGDDYVLVEKEQGVAAHAVFNLFKQDPQGLRRVGIDVAPSDTVLNWHGKVELETVTLAGRQLAMRMDICALLLPTISKNQLTTIATATPREAALALAPSGVLQLPGDQGAGFAFLADLVRKLPAFRVRLSNDPLEIAKVIGSFLSEDGWNAG
jgi:hypothetical protein